MATAVVAARALGWVVAQLLTCDCHLQPSPSSSAWWRLTTQPSTPTCSTWRLAKGNTSKDFSQSCNQMSWQRDPPITSKRRFYFLDLKTGFSYKCFTSLHSSPNFGWHIASLMNEKPTAVSISGFFQPISWAVTFENMTIVWVMSGSISCFGEDSSLLFSIEW